MKKPEIGDVIYVPTSLHVYRGEDDVRGGLATIKKVKTNDFLPEDHYNYYMVETNEHPGHGYNYRYLLENQDEWEKRFGNQVAYPDPDDREEFNQPEADWKTI